MAAKSLVIPHARRGLITATDEALIFRRGHHREIAILWADAMLLEVWTFGAGKTQQRGFTLYGRDAYIEWDMPASKKKLAPQDEDLRRELLDLITARTGLTPRTLSSELQAPSSPMARKRQISLSGTGFIVVLIALPFGFAAAALILPLTREPLLNDYVAFSFGVIGLILLGVAIRAYVELFRPRSELPALALPLFEVAPPPDATGTGKFGLRWNTPVSDRLLDCAAGLLLSANAVPAAWSPNEFQTPSGAIDPPHPPQQYLAVWLLMIAFVGILLVYQGLRPGRHVVLADDSGLSMRSGRRMETLRWTDVERLTAYVTQGKVRRYEVVGDAGEITVQWPLHVRALPLRTAQSVTAGEVAALAEKRSGNRLEIEK